MTNWQSIAERGELTMTVHTRAHALKVGLPIHPDAEYVGVSHSDAGENTPVSYLTFDGLREYVDTMQPRSIEVLGDTATSRFIQRLSDGTQ